MAEIVCEKGLRINCRIGNRYLNWFAENYCVKIVELEIVTLISLPKSIAKNLSNRKCYLEKVCGKVLRKLSVFRINSENLRSKTHWNNKNLYLTAVC